MLQVSAGPKPPIFQFPTAEIYQNDVLHSIKRAVASRNEKIRKKGSIPIEKKRNVLRKIQNADGKQKSEKYGRYLHYMQRGFHSDPSEPYKELGDVVLGSGDILLYGITEDLKSEIKPVLPQGELRFPKKYHLNEEVEQALDVRENPQLIRTGADPTFPRISDYISDMKAVQQQLIYDYSTLSDKLHQLRLRNDREDEGDLASMIDPYKTAEILKAAETGSIGRIAKERSEYYLRLTSEAKLGNKEVHKKISNMSNIFEAENKTSDKPDLDKIELIARDQLLSEYREKSAKKYRYKKLHIINILLCAIFNMKSKTIKTNTPISRKRVRNLFYSDIQLDAEGRPRPCREISRIAMFDSDTESNYSPFLPVNKEVTTQAAKQASHLKMHSSSKLRRQKMAGADQIEPQRPQVKTWKDLVENTPGVVNCNLFRPVVVETVNKFDFNKEEQKMMVSSRQWHYVEDIQQMILLDKEKQNKATEKTAITRLNDLKERFDYAKRKHSRLVEKDLTEKKRDQYRVLNYKINHIKTNQLGDGAIAKMRHDGQKLRKEISLAQKEARKWFLDLKDEMYRLQGRSDKKTKKLLSLVARFQFEDHRTIADGKEKLCLLFMSMPTYVLLTQNMMDAIDFVLTKILGGIDDLIVIWLKARKVYQLSKTMHLIARNG